MNTQSASGAPAEMSLIKGIPLAEEPGIGALTLPSYLAEIAERYGQREALVFHAPEGEVRWTYAELKDRAEEVAKALLACGIGKGMRVGVLMTNRPEWISATWGATLAGGIAVGLSTFSTPAELDYLLDLSAVSVLLIERDVLKKDFAAILQELAPEIAAARPGEIHTSKYPFLRHVATVGEAPSGTAIEGWDAFLSRGASIPSSLVQAASATVKPSDPGLMLFSSGSTNKPKGIMNAHRGVCLQLWRMPRIFNVSGDIRCWSANGFFWSGNFGQALGSTLSVGGSVVLQRTFLAEEALELMEKERVNLPIAWPHQWAQLEGASNYLSTDLSSLRFVDRNTPLARHPSVTSDYDQPNAAYGNTETFTISSIYASGTPLEEIAGSSGKPLPGNMFKIVDPLTGETVKRGERGEIAVKGATLMLGYVGVPLDETLDEEGFFRTGDGGYIDAEGRLYWEGRLNDIIKTGGANVSPLEIDAVLATYPGVKVTQTVGVPHDTLGEIVVACIVPHDGQSLDGEEIRAFAKESLASYKVPRKVLFFREDELAMTGSNKVKAADLRQVAAKRLDEEALTPA